ncbi:hypothetical protein CPB84DRAFT_294312 [Gymnopilus junonius]|uniref:Uncharacterized protein n=1 Tax=Gymnopilus junonius TaxID=109634 RepID=A0A9P5NS80_GYMJU|nr:hypothetical protein CPB84DRAFT_294312 [Gymnopilus junonius]
MVSGVSTFSEDIHGPPYRVSSIETTAIGKGKGKAADTSITSFTDLEGVSGAFSIADRAKMRQRSQKQPPSSIIEIPSDEEYEVDLKASSLKSKSKGKAKPKAKDKGKTAEKGSSSAVSEPTPNAVPKPRPRPRPIHPIRPKSTHDGIGVIPIPGVDHYRSVSTPPSPSHDVEIPIATSTPARPDPMSWRPDIGQPGSSPLPPSDPPGPSMSTTYNESGYGIPRIETLPNQDEPGKLSSPSSLFSDSASSSKKRKRSPLDIDTEVDQLETSQNAAPVTWGDMARMRFYKGSDYVSPRHMPPPGTFFAGSSQSSIGGGKGYGDLPPGPTPARQSAPQHEIVDLTMLPPTMILSTTAKTSASKPKKPRKHKVTVEDEDLMPPPMIVLDEDEQDEDFDPNDDGETKKKKKKPKAAQKEKKSATGKVTSKKTQVTESSSKRKTQVEVVIATKPPKKGKKKEKSTPSTTESQSKDKDKGEKETFKSAEFIDDSDDDADPLRLVEGAADSITRPAPVPTASPLTKSPYSSIPSVPSSSSKPKQPEDTLSSLNPKSDFDMPKSSLPTKKRTSGSIKRKAVLDSEANKICLLLRTTRPSS